jgi:DNA-binding transcriptional MocR family regulator
MDWSGLADRSPRGIAARLAREITGGRLVPGERLPTVREVATELGVSPATVSEAWQALRRAGLVVSRGRAGSFVGEVTRRDLPPRVQGLMGRQADAALDLSRGIPDPRLLPSLEPALQRVQLRASTSVYQDDPVLPALRELLARTWPAPVDGLTVVDGAQDGVGRALEQVVRLGDRVIVESPGYPPFLDLIEVLGAEPVPVLLDEAGVRPESLRRALERRPAAMILQPRAQNPTGVSMSAERAAELARVLAGAERPVWVVEDDHSGSISTSPDVSLATYLPERVVHVRGFSKSHGPELRVAALGGPAALVDRIVARRMLGTGWTSRMIQTILADLLTAARSLDEVAEARRQYFARQGAVMAALADRGVVVPAPDGINLWLPVEDERAALVQLATAGIRVAGGAPFLAPGTEEAVGPHVRVTTGLVDAEHAPAVAAALAGVVRVRPAASRRPPR